MPRPDVERDDGPDRRPTPPGANPGPPGYCGAGDIGDCANDPADADDEDPPGVEPARTDGTGPLGPLLAPLAPDVPPPPAAEAGALLALPVGDELASLVPKMRSRARRYSSSRCSIDFDGVLAPELLDVDGGLAVLAGRFRICILGGGADAEAGAIEGPARFLKDKSVWYSCGNKGGPNCGVAHRRICTITKTGVGPTAPRRLPMTRKPSHGGGCKGTSSRGHTHHSSPSACSVQKQQNSRGIPDLPVCRLCTPKPLVVAGRRRSRSGARCRFRRDARGRGSR